MTIHEYRLECLLEDLERECDRRCLPKGSLFTLETAPPWALEIMNAHIIRLRSGDRAELVSALKGIYGSGRDDIVVSA